MDATKRSTQTVIVSGKGNKKNEAFASALNDVSKKVLKESNYSSGKRTSLYRKISVLLLS